MRCPLCCKAETWEPRTGRGSPLPTNRASGRLRRIFARHWLILAALGTLLEPATAGAFTNLYFTRFEASEGYDTAYTLVGQAGWLGEGTGGNGLVNGFFPGEGQQAYLGYWPPLETNESQTAVWQPLRFDPVRSGLPLVQFSVLMSIEDSSATNAQYDNFQWQVYNLRTNRLLTIDFDNYFQDISYRLDGTSAWVTTSVKFTNGVPELLVLNMDFAANRWSATFGGRLIATNQPLTTTGAELTLGEIDAVWVYYDPAKPGDNYMLFDNYRVAAAPPAVAPRLLLLERTPRGHVWLRVQGQPSARYVIEAAPALPAATWTPLRTNSSPDGLFDWVDTTASNAPARFYRARLLP
ncbi:hypothetical protein [Limisphaera sp. VF-2]|uniref:hypothetical protein n=1 Tax=Limisphaera sp. VF-2 TaxID=3400418 RepID=UPI001761C0F5|nr:hypothetical protein [Limisphaera sp.]